MSAVWTPTTNAAFAVLRYVAIVAMVNCVVSAWRIYELDYALSVAVPIIMGAHAAMPRMPQVVLGWVAVSRVARGLYDLLQFRMSR
jgi:hypothetical protein